MTRHTLTEGDVKAAVRRGQVRAAREFRATTVRYRRDEDAVEIVTTRNGGFLVPRRWVAPLAGLKPADLEHIEVWSGGAAFALPGRDIQIDVHGLLLDALPRLLSKAAVLPILGRSAAPAAATPRAGDRPGAAKRRRSGKSDVAA